MDRPAQVVMIVHEAEGILGASFPDYPGATTVARSADALRTKAAAMLAAYLDGLHAAGEPVPTPRPLADLERSAEFRESARTGTVTVLEVQLPSAIVGEDRTAA